MTEAQWLACNEPRLLLGFLGDDVSRRKLRLFAVACCRAAEKHVGVGKSVRKLINACEAYADASRHQIKLLGAFHKAGDEVITAQQQHYAGGRRGKGMVLETIVSACDPNDARAAALNACVIPPDAFGPNSMKGVRPALVRDVFGNPFRSVSTDPFCHTSTVRQLAEAIYEDRAFDRMPVLGDALEDAGCSNDDILGHCRVPVSHVKGCWVIDLLLEKK